MKRFIDPPDGWRYGFPKELPLGVVDHRAWLVEQGYPAYYIEEMGEHFWCRYWTEDEEGV